MSIENITLTHFRNFSSLFTNLSSTPVERALQIAPFLTNKANFQKVKLDTSDYIIMNYAKWTLGERGKNKANSKPIQSQFKANTKPIQTQTKPISKGGNTH
jgi:hypothetical protein